MWRHVFVLPAAGMLVAAVACAGSQEAAPSTTRMPATSAAPTTVVDSQPDVVGTSGVVVGCDLPDDAGSVTIECDGLSFDVSVPESCLAESCGLIVDVPGGTGGAGAEIAERHTEMQERGNAAGYVVVQPDVPPDGWNYQVDSVRIRSVLEQLIEALDIDQNRVHIGGHSSGGYIAWAFVCDHADLIASAAPLGAGASTEDDSSCEFDTPGHPSEEIDIFLAHGRTDRVVPFETALAQRDLVLAEWDMAGDQVLAATPEHSWTRWTSPSGTVFEFLEFDWYGGFLLGHCIPGVAKEIGCGADTPVHYGQAALDFYIAHPKNE